MFKPFLILFCLVCFPSLAFGQQFDLAVNHSLYSQPASDYSFIPPSSGYAVLVVTYVPRGNVTSASRVLSANIVSRVTNSSSEYMLGNLGWYRRVTVDGVDGYELCSVVDASTFYTHATPTTSSLSDVLFPQVQEILVAKNLGTVAQRQALINTFSVQFPTLVEPSALYNSFLKQLQPFILKFLAVGLILLSVSKGLNYLEKLAAVKHKQREAFRKRGEKIVQARDKEYTLLEEWTVAAAVRYVENPTRLSRKEFYEQLKEYNDYRASKGWKY